MIKILDLFCGAGGFSSGLDNTKKFKTVIAVDNDKNALETFKYNLNPKHLLCLDISDKKNQEKIIYLSKKEKIQMVIGGWPCQGLSLKGKKEGLKDKRNYLCFDILNIIENVSPDLVLLENVKQLLSKKNEYFLSRILSKLKKEKYFIDFKILNAKFFNVPQNRERFFLLASKKPLFLPNNKLTNSLTSVKSSIIDLSYLNSGEGVFKSKYKENSCSTKYIDNLKKNSSFLYNHISTNHRPIAIQKLKLIPPGGSKLDLPKELRGKQLFTKTWSRLKWDEISPTIDTRFDTPSNGQNSHPYLNRAITPREAARIQGFDDKYVFLGRKTSVCKQIGNAVSPILSKEIGNFIAKQLVNNLSITKKNYSIYLADCNNKIKEFIFNKKMVDHIITDPPYKISKNNNFHTLKNAKRQGIFFGEWDKNFNTTEWIKNAVKILSKNGSFIVFCSYIWLSFIIKELESNGLIVKDVIKWKKTNPMPRNINRRYVSDTEYAIWAVREKSKWVFNKPSNVSYLRSEFISSTVSGSERTIHPNQKSLKLMIELIKIHTNENDLIFDPFMGSGTTGVACSLTKRRFVGCENKKNFFLVSKERLKTLS